MREAERKRLVYVAATRARDVLIVPRAGEPKPRWICGTLLAGGDATPAISAPPIHSPGAHAAWFDEAAPPAPGTPDVADEPDGLREWGGRARRAMRARGRPAAFTDAARARPFRGQRGRHGPLFGETVHLAIGAAVRIEMDAAAAVRWAAERTRLADHLLGAATEDVERAVRTLDALGVSRGGTTWRLEYPIAGIDPDGTLVAGFADLVFEDGPALAVLDFKTDAPPPDNPIAERYVAQVSGYATALAAALASTSAGAVRAGLLYTADGEVRWLDAG
jgi:ATP-dependent helicase/nuclease subunit A